MTDIIHQIGAALLMAAGMFWQVSWSLVPVPAIAGA
jgi:hypothetical protein